MAVENQRTTTIEEEVRSIVEKEMNEGSVPPAFYNDEDPPEPPEDDPHWQEFPFFDGVKSSHLLAAGIVAFLLFATMAHLLILLAPMN